VWESFVYVPKANEETRVEVMHALMRAHPLASLVTLNSGELFATHLPMVVHEGGGEFGVLRGHVARANPQWKDFDASVEALAIFAGPQHYITPTWYPSKHETGKEVPTWNYAVVHACGPLRVVEDAEWLMAHLESLTDEQEAGRTAPWKVSDAPAEYVRQLVNGIVGLEVVVRRLEGKWKVSQNKREPEKRGVISGLAALGTDESAAMRALVAERAGFAESK
jgi:transcriptional regulator